MKSKEKLRKMRVDIRLGLTAKELAKKYNISEVAARNYRTHYLKAIKRQKELKVNANY
ncbi:hypothetical protein [Tepidibacter thalassicus]|uniref:Uncharacterized protein n=1 Tax=Tepidibacter thalassicus DSM 15285 TaxID=1123350 RepID=A0A1M5PYE3_9FIRM|nr:hypothetical protein [Tepidibacter thalassicus]SHH06283.1 hypothetical protein SAMN02744040_00651 [Tepidibacter thalassicus DSM 15285]